MSQAAPPPSAAVRTDEPLAQMPQSGTATRTAGPLREVFQAAGAEILNRPYCARAWNSSSFGFSSPWIT